MSRIDANKSGPSQMLGDGRLPRFEFLAGRLALDFCNTHSRASGGDRLADLNGLATWAGRLGRPFSATLDPRDLTRFRALRDHLCRLFDAILHGGTPAQTDLDAMAAAARPIHAEKLHWDAAARRAITGAAADSADQLYLDIAADALDLVTGASLERLKRCPSETCQWFFFDSSRNGKRRWCAMADCGTKAKVRLYRARHAATPDPAF